MQVRVLPGSVLWQGCLLQSSQSFLRPSRWRNVQSGGRRRCGCAAGAYLLGRPRGPMDKALAHGAGDCRLESYRGQLSCLASVAGQLPHRGISKIEFGAWAATCSHAGRLAAAGARGGVAELRLESFAGLQDDSTASGHADPVSVRRQRRHELRLAGPTCLSCPCLNSSWLTQLGAPAAACHPYLDRCWPHALVANQYYSCPSRGQQAPWPNG